MGKREFKKVAQPCWMEIKNLPPSQVCISIIVVNFNGGEDVLKCLRSLETTRKEELEVIVVDNASVDGSPERIEKTFPHVRLIRMTTNWGFGGGNNLGACYAMGHYLAFLNQDAFVEPNSLKALRQALEANPKAGMATARILLSEHPNTVNTCGNNVHISGLTLCRGMGQPRQAYDTPAVVGAVSGAAFLMRRELFEQLGGFDERFFMYMEDTDLSLRARLAGWHILYVPDAVVYHNYRLRFGACKTFYQERNRYMMLLKVLQWRTLLVLLPTLLLAEVVTWGFVLFHEPHRMGNKLAAYAAILQDRAVLKNAREFTQLTRKIHDRDLLVTSVHQLAFEQIGKGIIVNLAHWIFNPIFRACHSLSLRLVSW
jgi:GT2 family glycosyltransferase